ncbi:MAG: DUF309 domain-containing protein [Planctomycetales bacterium]|nr:DUF309 domain-containing protein [Planctomycetales bacterium]
MPDYDPRYLEGIRLFNECEFFESHDAWEELWTEYHGPSRDFFKGLIQVAVCLVHFNNGNVHGARKLYQSSTNYLRPYAPIHEGLNLEKLLVELESCCAPIFVGDEEQWSRAELDPDLIPELHLDDGDHAEEHR